MGKSLRIIVKEIFRIYNITKTFNVDATKFENFLDALERGYQVNGNPYHNDQHACEVVHSVHCLLHLSSVSVRDSSMKYP